MNVYLEKCSSYDQERINKVTAKWDTLFKNAIVPGDVVVLKPNWIAHSHKFEKNEWQSVITHPLVITAVLKVVLDCLKGEGKIIITDGPQTDSSWYKIMNRMTPDLWIKMGKTAGIEIDILDLREDEWISDKDVTVSRRKLAGDPLGSVEFDLGINSEFISHQPSKKGYYGADYNKAETNLAHSNNSHKYRVSRTIIESDVFINLPKLKTHKKAGITCSLKNLVGINTYKNFLPHHNEGTPDEGGDQFPESSKKNKTESFFIEKFKQLLLNHPERGRFFIPVKNVGKKIFGDTKDTIRSGNWYGNETLWRMVLDLNKILFYGNPDGTFRNSEQGNRKKYISIVDGIIAGEGNGPEAPTPKKTGLLIMGDNPVAVDALCAKMMGFNWQKIPAIYQAFNIKNYPLIDCAYEDIIAVSSANKYNKHIKDISLNDVYHFKPHFGWLGHVEANK